MSGYEDYQDHGECERCGDTCRTNSPSTVGFGLAAYICNRCYREFVLLGAKTPEIQAWNKARAHEAAMKLKMKNPIGFGATNEDRLAALCLAYEEAHIATENAQNQVNAMAARFLANKYP